MAEITAGTVATYLDHLQRADERGALDVVIQLATEGLDTADLIEALIRTSLMEVGARWERGEWSVSQEHIATQINDQALTWLADRTPPPEVAAGSAVVACAEGEWHSLAARTLAVGLGAAGWDVTTLGTSVPASQLDAALHDLGPDAVLVSCSLPANLPGAHNMIMAARSAHTPVIVGGAGFGEGSERASFLGANAWASDLPGAARAVKHTERFTDPSPPLDHDSYGDYASLMHRQGVVATTLEAALGADGCRPEGAQEAVWMLRSLTAALLCNDRSILVDHMRWHDRRAVRGLSVAVEPVCDAVGEALPADASTAKAWLDAAMQDAGV